MGGILVLHIGFLCMFDENVSYITQIDRVRSSLVYRKALTRESALAESSSS